MSTPSGRHPRGLPTIIESHEYLSVRAGLLRCGQVTCKDGVVTRATRWMLLALLVAYPVMVIALATSSGVLLSQDSVSYLAAARALAAGDGLTSFDGQPLTLFPPGLSILLGAADGLGASAESAAVVINAVCAALVVLGTYLLGRQAQRSAWLALAAAAVVSLSAPFTLSFVWLWSEPVFTVLVLALLLLLVWSIRRGRCPWWAVIVAGLLVSGAISVRYVGYVLLPIVALGIWWAARSWVRVLVALAVGVLAPALIVARNLGAGSGPLGDRYPGVRTLLDSAAEAVGVLGTFLLPSASAGIAVVLGSLVAVLVLVGVWAGLVDRDRVVGLLGAFAVLYVVAIVWSQTATRLDPPTPRLLTPALPALAVLALSGLSVVVARLRRDVLTWTATSPSDAVRARGEAVAAAVRWVVLGLVVVGAVAASVRADMRLIQDAREGVLGLRAAASGSVLATEGIAIPGAAGFASNDPWRMYLAIGKAPVVPLPPSPAEWPSDRIDRDLRVLREVVGSGAVTHALVVDGGAETLGWPELAAAGVDAVLVAETPEGGIYRLATAG